MTTINNSNHPLTQIEAHRVCEGEQRVYEHRATTLNCTMRFAIYLPQSSMAPVEKKLPVLFYLSGLTCSEQNVIQKAGFQRFADQHQIMVVCPDTSPRGDGVADDERYWLGQGAGFYVNATQAPWSTHYRMYDYITDELPTLIHQYFPTTGQQSITGHSMGGYGALLIGLKNPQNYQSISAFSPIVSPANSEWGQDTLPAYLGHDENDWQAVDPCALVKTSQAHRPILIDQGDADNFLSNNLKTHLFETAVRDVTSPVSIHLRPGYDHSYYFVQSFIDTHFAFHASYLHN